MDYSGIKQLMHGPRQKMRVRAGELEWIVERSADMESIWESMDILDEDERLPYWSELWPATLLLCQWLGDNPEMAAGRRCLDLGCGLGLAGIVAAHCGGSVLGMDYEWPAVYFASRNARRNLDPRAGLPTWAMMDWRRPAVRAGAFDLILASDVMYERRFVEPVARFLDHALAPDGEAWVAEPNRNVYGPFNNHLAQGGWAVTKADTRIIRPEHDPGTKVTVNLWRMRR